MTDTPNRRRSRMNRTERAEHLYTARAHEYTTETEQPLQQTETVYQPNEADDVYAGYQPNEPQNDYAAYQPNEMEEYEGYTPNELPVQPQVDYSAYYSREGAELEDAAEPAFAPPPSMQQYAFEPQAWEEETPYEEDEYASGNVYHPRQVTWTEEDREDVIAASELGYQVQQEEQPVRRKRHTLRNLLIAVLVLAVLGGAVWILREPIAEKLGITLFVTTPTEEPAAVTVTPAPIKAYDAAQVAAVPDIARNTIAKLSGTLVMENYNVTDRHVVTRNQRADGSYDFYLFTSEGRLLCYFEGLQAQDMMPQEHGFYVSQAPWLITPSGSALIRTSDIEAAIKESVFLHPMYRGWAVVESTADGSANYVNADGQLMSSLWFSRTFPFTGEYTLAYVDTGSTAGQNERYLLYVLDTEGSMTRWRASSHMEDVLAAVCGMACMNDGSVYKLPETDAPIVQSPQNTAYLDCDAMVVKDSLSGKYGLRESRMQYK